MKSIIDRDQQESGASSVNMTPSPLDESHDDAENEETVNGAHQSINVEDNQIHREMLLSPGEKIIFKKMVDLMAEVK